MRELAFFVIRRRWWGIATTLVALPVLALYGGGVHDKLSTGGITDPGAESSRGAAALAAQFPSSGQSDFVIVVTVRHGTVNSPEVRSAGLALKAFGVGLGIAVLVDAFLVRQRWCRFMRLAGRSNWWSPRWLRRFHLRFGIWENALIALLDRQFEVSR